jgi:SulP family sulfate permease
MAAYLENLRGVNPIVTNLRDIPAFFSRPVPIFQSYKRTSWRPDIIAGLTVAVVLLPAELPPEMGLYTAIIGGIIGALWGSSNHLQTGPTNAISLLVLSTLLTISVPGTAQYVILAGLLAVMVGVLQLVMGLARLGVLVNFVSHSVIVGFSAGAGVLIAVRQLRPLLGLDFPSHSFIETVGGVGGELIAGNIHWPTAALGLGTILLLVLLKRFRPKLPGPLIGMIVAAAAVALLGLDQNGVDVIGELPRGLPPFAKLPLFDLELIGQLSAGALAIAAIGLIEAMSIARSISNQSNQRLDSNQEFVGQGLANIASGFFSGYAGSGSFTRSAVNYNAGARTPMASVLSGLFVLVAMNVLAPFAAYVPRSALAAVLIVIAVGMIDRAEIRRILRGAPADAVIMIVTFLGTLLLHLEFAVLVGILLSFAFYIMKTSVPQVTPVVPDENFKHFNPQNHKPSCLQLANIDISGDLYFGAVSHLEKVISRYSSRHPEQRFLLLRMHSVNQCDFSGIHALESVVRIYRDQGGDVFMVRVRDHIREFMKSTGFYDYLGADHFLSEDEAVSYLFYRIIDPAVCIYECEVKIFKECQNLPKQIYHAEIPLHTEIPAASVSKVTPQELWEQLHHARPPLVIDVREAREFRQGHVPEAQLMPLPTLLPAGVELPAERQIIFVCRGGRRSTRAAYLLHKRGYANVSMLQGGMLAWQTAGLLEAIDL